MSTFNPCRWTPEHDARLRSLVIEGKSRLDIACAFDCSQSTITRHCRKLGITFSHDIADAKRREAMVSRWQMPEYRAMISAKASASWTDERRATMRARSLAAKERGASFPPKDKRLDWCPAEYREDYNLLKRSKMTAAEAREIIEAQMVRDAKRNEGLTNA